MKSRKLPFLFVSGVFLLAFAVLLPSLRWTHIQSSNYDSYYSDGGDSLSILPDLSQSNGHRTRSLAARSFDEKELENTFSACLLVMDDNHRLTEWVAYHHHVLPLRYLIVAVDPRSKTSPMDVLRKWEPFMKVILWENDHFVPEHRRTLSQNATMEEKTRLHRARQSFFLSACATAMSEANRTYVALVDSDEYITFNRPENVTLPNNSATPEDLRSILPPSVEEAGSVLRVLQEARDLRPNSTLAAPCLPIYRVLFNAKESSDQERQLHVPPSISNATRFDTMRYRYRMRDADGEQNTYTQLGKNIFDASRIKPHDLTKPRKFFPNPHQILYPDYCWNVHSLRDQVSFFRVAHYLGSWESYSARDDARNSASWRTKKDWEKRTRGMEGNDKADDTIRPWLRGFVQQHGEVEATYLLQDAGYIPPKELS